MTAPPTGPVDHPAPAPGRSAAAPGVTGEPVADPSDSSLGDLIGGVARDLSTLMRQELALARAELTQEAGRVGKAAGAFGGAGVAGHFALLFLSLAIWAGLSSAMHPGWAALLMAFAWAGAAGVLYATGRSSMRMFDPTPERTVETLSKVPHALRGRRGGTR